ncbi:MAG: hypothetical protein Edafosvirus11_33 [Edafosvirus sp.]|uniref:Uncharacterized protein n=1 Tax=Edafosvirus sp. TaxID=2487765 RepID=A0A3G4ZU21_9VIRU|nr:MAG: hypothetical protein Edafosvirus11_33 [Edafosvirus sp.]
MSSIKEEYLNGLKLSITGRKAQKAISYIEKLTECTPFDYTFKKKITIQFIRAINKNMHTVIKCFIEGKLNFDLQDDNGGTPLIWSIRNKMEDLSILLIETGSDVNVREKDGRTPLIEAVCQMNLKITKKLIGFGCHIGIADKGGTFAVERVIERCYKNESIGIQLFDCLTKKCCDNYYQSDIQKIFKSISFRGHRMTPLTKDIYEKIILNNNFGIAHCNCKFPLFINKILIESNQWPKKEITIDVLKMNDKDKYGDTALIYCIRNLVDDEMALRLINMKCDIQFKCNKKYNINGISILELSLRYYKFTVTLALILRYIELNDITFMDEIKENQLVFNDYQNCLCREDIKKKLMPLHINKLLLIIRHNIYLLHGPLNNKDIIGLIVGYMM